jgi:hypothetical protein
MANSSGPQTGEGLDSVKDRPRQFFQPLPREVIRYWLEGSYTGGIAPSIAYDQLGWALMLRGFYRYRVSTTKVPVSHRGYCVIDLQNGEICCRGIRVYSDAAEWDGIANNIHPFLWKSEVSTIRAGRSRARLSCAQRLLATKEWRALPLTSNLLSSKDPTETTDEQKAAIDYIAATRFDQDWEAINGSIKVVKQDSQEIFSGFMVYAMVPRAEDSVKLQGDFNTFGVAGVHGQLEFTRIDDAVW